MTDANLQELERAFRSSGSVEDEAAWLRARMRSGALERAGLELAAYCGHEASRAVLGGAPLLANVSEWAKGLVDQPDDVCVRVALAVGWLTLSAYQPDSAAPDSKAHLRATLETVERWALNKKLRAPAPNTMRPGLPPAVRAITLVGLLRAQVPEFPPMDPEPQRMAPRVIAEAARVEGITDDAIREAIRDELAPWALGYSDPVRERVEARQQEAAGE